MSTQLRSSPRLATKASAPETVATLETILFNLLAPLFAQLQETRDTNDRMYIIHDIMTLMRISRKILIRSPKLRTTLSTTINRLWSQMERRTDLDPVLKRKCNACFSDLETMLDDIRSDPSYVA